MNAEKALFGLLQEANSLEKLILEGFTSNFIPTEELRPVYDWAVRVFRLSGNKVAPTKMMFEESEAEGGHGRSWADVLRDYGISLDYTPEESVEWIVENLKARHYTSKAGEFAKELAAEINLAPDEDRPLVLVQQSAKLVALALSTQTKRQSYSLSDEGQDIIIDYEHRKADGNQFNGMRLGLDIVDDHTNGLHAGELMVIGAPPKMGKSYMLDRVALTEFQHDRSVALFTLENSIEMTRDRIACMATGIDPIRFERGEITLEEELAVYQWVGDMIQPKDSKLWIVSPPLGGRTIESMVSQAQIRGCESLIIDQLTFVDAIRQGADRYLQIREILHQLKTLISTGDQRMPCLLAHQMTREGIKLARKNGFFHMEDMAEGSEVERTSDWAMAMWASDDMRQVNQFLFQTLACRRRDNKHWNVYWDISTGEMSPIGEEILT